MKKLTFVASKSKTVGGFGGQPSLRRPVCADDKAIKAAKTRKFCMMTLFLDN